MVAWLLDEAEGAAARHFVDEAERVDEAANRAMELVTSHLMDQEMGGAAVWAFAGETALMATEMVLEQLMDEGETEMDLYLEDCKEERLRGDFYATRRVAARDKVSRRVHAKAWDVGKETELEELEERRRQEAHACYRKARAEKVSRRALASGAMRALEEEDERIGAEKARIEKMEKARVRIEEKMVKEAKEEVRSGHSNLPPKPRPTSPQRRIAASCADAVTGQAVGEAARGVGGGGG